VQTTQM